MERALVAKVMLAGAVLAVLGTHAAVAEDWRFCLAPSYAQHKIYISEAFPSRVLRDYSGQVFENALSAARFAHDSAQCPRSDDQYSALAGRDYAIEYNRREHNEVIEFKWRP